MWLQSDSQNFCEDDFTRFSSQKADQNAPLGTYFPWRAGIHMKNQLIFPKAVFAGKSGENSVSLVDAARFPVADVARLQMDGRETMEDRCVLVVRLNCCQSK